MLHLGLGPGGGDLELAQDDLLDRPPDLMGTDVGADLPHARPEAGEADRPDRVGHRQAGAGARRDRAVLDEEQRGAGGEVGVHGVAEDHRHPHRRRGDAEGDEGRAGLDDLGGADEELAAVAVGDQGLQTGLEAPAEVVAVEPVDPAVHEAEAVGRADHGVEPQVEDRPPVDLHTRQVAAVAVPGIGQGGVHGGQDDPQRPLRYCCSPCCWTSPEACPRWLG